MRFPHNAKIFRGQLDVAPFAGVFFVLLIFLFAQSTLLFIPGVPVSLPESADLPGVAMPTVSVAVDADGLIYYQNQVIEEAPLLAKLRGEVARSKESLTLIIQADRTVSCEIMVQLAVLARKAGIKNAVLATRPAVIPQPLAPNS
jgi:biopolymer transport protein ExbD